jgi:uncharacterized protein YukE
MSFNRALELAGIKVTESVEVQLSNSDIKQYAKLINELFDDVDRYENSVILEKLCDSVVNSQIEFLGEGFWSKLNNMKDSVKGALGVAKDAKDAAAEKVAATAAKAANAAKAVGGAVADKAKAVGGAVADKAKEVGGAVKASYDENKAKAIAARQEQTLAKVQSMVTKDIKTYIGKLAQMSKDAFGEMHPAINAVIKQLAPLATA